MLSIVLFGSAFAACGLPTEIDPNGECVTDANGWSTMDADSDDAIPISLTISAKDATTDAFDLVHGATAGTLTDTTEAKMLTNSCSSPNYDELTNYSSLFHEFLNTFSSTC